MIANVPLDQRIDSAIGASPYLGGRKLEFRMEAGRVILEGTVGTYFQKQMAQETVLRVDGVQRIENRLRVLSSREVPAASPSIAAC